MADFGLLPEFLPKLLAEQYSSADVERIIEGYEAKRPVTLRVNTLKADVSDVLKTFDGCGIRYEQVAWSDCAFVLPEASESDLRPLDVYSDGKIYLQSLSSQLPPVVMDLKEGQDVLDMAAAPGGKTTQIAALTSNRAHLTACERDAVRAEQLRYNLKKQGASANVMQTDSRMLDSFFRFDNVLLDAPCSGSGILNVRNKKLFQTFTPKLIAKTTALQKGLLKKALTVLKKGQTMVYSTCSVLSAENEDAVRGVLKEFNAEIVPVRFDGMQTLPLLPTSLDGTLCVCPNELYEGFFVAKIRKNA